MTVYCCGICERRSAEQQIDDHARNVHDKDPIEIDFKPVDVN